MKKHICLLVLLLVSSVNLMSQTLSNENFIYTAAPQKAVQAANYNTLTKADVQQNVTYFDGLGRPIQSIAINQGGNGSDIVTYMEYDAFGRQVKNYLPYSFTNAGDEYLKTNALIATGTFYNTPKYENTINPFSQKLFEASPLNRVLQQAAPGNDWALGAGHEIKLDYQTNIANEVKLYTASTIQNATSGLYDPSLGNNDGSVFYGAGQLYKTITYDENTAAVPTESNGSTVEFKNKQGQVVLKRTYESGIKHDTYYVYDDFGNLTYVLPPLPIQDNPGGVNSITTGYNNFNKYFDQSVFSGTTSGGGSVSVSIANNVLTVTFSGSFMTSYLNTTPQDLPTNPCLLPDMPLGTICGGAYSVSIVGGKLKLSSNYGAQVGSFSATFTVTLPTTCTPRPANIISQALLDDLCYQYKYDYRNRLAEKKLPGKQWEYIVYDKLDRVVATGPALSPFTDIPYYTSGWLITKYDALNRPVYTGWENTAAYTSTRITKQTAQNALTTSLNETKQTSGTIDGISAYYSNAVAPTVFKLLTVNYYDDYNFTSAPTFPAYSFDNVPSFYNNSTALPKGLPTGSWTRILTTSSSLTGETSYVLYDSKARPIENYTANYLGGFTRTDIKLDFPGKPYLTYTTHRRTASDATILVQEGFTYSPQGRLLTHTHQIGTGTVQLLASNTYDELGQLIAKKVGGVDTTGATGLQTVDYTYNIRGWLKGINDVATINVPGNGNTDLFAFKINYNDITDPTKKLYNGNISQTSWESANSDKTLRSYTYAYDKLNRLKTATDNQGRYNENLWYDRNGNITAITRLGNTAPGTATFGTIDNLAYTYDTGNKLIKVEDSSGNTEGFTDGSHAAIEYTYDANGNMTSDLNKGIGTATTAGITYNHLNLPTKIIFATGTTTGNIVYIYNAVGQKVQKIVNQLTPSVNTTTTDYLGGIQYTKINSGIINLQFLPTAEGYVTNNSGIFSYVYQYKDHLGNVRLSYDKNLQIVEENNYYPFGMIQKGYNNIPNFSLGNSTQKYRYNGKELQDELGLNMYDYGARNYDPALGRWMNIDPLAETSRRFSPYTYALNNPVKFIDPDGMEAYTSQVNRSAEMSNDEWLSSNRRDMDKMAGGTGVDVGTGTYSLEEQKAQQKKENGDSTEGEDSEPTVGGIPISSDNTNYYFWNSITNSYTTVPIFSSTLNNFKNESEGSHYLRMQASEGITPMEFSSPLFPMAWAGKLFSTVGGAIVTERVATVLEGAVKSNYGRFVRSMPVNSKSSATFQVLEDGNYLFSATSPGRVLGSSALYQKWVNAQGETFKMLKTTFAPDGSIIHIKPK